MREGLQDLKAPSSSPAKPKVFEVLVFNRASEILVSVTKNGDGLGSFMLRDEDTNKVDSIKDLIDGWNAEIDKPQGTVRTNVPKSG